MFFTVIFLRHFSSFLFLFSISFHLIISIFFISSRLSGGVRTSVPDTHGSLESEFLYFDIFSLWVAPVELDVEEESFIRIMRYLLIPFSLGLFSIQCFFISFVIFCCFFRYVQDVRSTLTGLESGTLGQSLKTEILSSLYRGTYVLTRVTIVIVKTACTFLFCFALCFVCFLYYFVFHFIFLVFLNHILFIYSIIYSIFFSFLFLFPGNRSWGYVDPRSLQLQFTELITSGKNYTDYYQ